MLGRTVGDPDRDRIGVAVAHAHATWMDLLAAEPGDPLRVEVRRIRPDLVATLAAGAPEVTWMQHVEGLGPGDADLVGELVAWAAGAGCPLRFPVAPSADVEALASALLAASAVPSAFTDVQLRWLDGPRPTPGDVEVRQVEAESPDASTFASALLEGHGVTADADPSHWSAAARFPEQPGYRCYLCLLDGEPAGGAILTVDHTTGTALLANASTRPGMRRRGVQAALVARRLADATAAGCDLAATLTEPAGASHRTMERAGFAVLHTCTTWQVPGPQAPST